MLFNSFEFLLFFPIVTIIFFLLPHKYRWFHLLAASCYFYMAFIPAYILILFFTIIIDYFAGILIENAAVKKRKAWLVVSLITNIGVLAYFKYYNFFIDNINTAFHLQGDSAWSLLGIILPIGLSFHTFQAMSYTIEVYRGNQKAERHFGIYALYVMFYPQLVAGPIERPQNILHQFYEKKNPDYSNFVIGFRLILFGFFKKVLIADRLALVVNEVYNDPAGHSSIALIVATVFFAFQIYCDFSGYSDIAIGCARVMGYKLMTNFNSPYQSKSISEFWKRWHISLSTWFRDYLYIPLGGNRVALPRIYLNLLIVFMVSGLWHGANWTYIIWGALHGIYLVFAMVTAGVRKKIADRIYLTRLPKLNNMLNVVVTFGLVTFAWIFFRAKSVDDAFYVISNMGLSFREITSVSSYTSALSELSGGDLVHGAFNIALGSLLITVLLWLEYRAKENAIADIVLPLPKAVRWGVYCTLIVCILVLGVYKNQEFIYFQF